MNIHIFGSVVRELADARELDQIAHIIRAHGPGLIGAEATFVLRAGEFSDFPEDAMAKGITIVPLRCHDPVAAIGVDWPSPHVAAPEEMSVLQTLGDAVALAIHHVHLTQSLREAHAQAEQSRRDCVTVLAMVGHDLRQPLAAIVNAMATMERTVDASVGERARAIMSRQIDHLRRIADDLLDAVQMQRGALTLNRVPIDAVELVSDCVDAVRTRVVDRHQRLTLSSSVPLWISGDPDRIRQIVSNLLDNAIKCTPTGGTIDVSAAADGEWVVLHVRDSGRGIAAEQMPHIFGLFLPERSDSGRGLGIGLSVVKRLTEAHGGRFEARSEGAGLGSTFTVRLPAHAATAQSIAV